MKPIPLILSLLAATIGTSFATGKPNILVIICDDLGYGDVGFNGCEDIKTPRLDKLAAEGIVCTNGYVTHPYCGPSRAGLMSGRYQARFGMEINVTNSHFDMHSGLPTSEKTFASRLKPAGYRTGAIGKWHLGASFPFHPNNRGFDYFYGFLSGGHTYFPENVTTITPLVHKEGVPHYSANEGGYWPLMRNDRAAEFDEYLTTALSRDAATFVKQGDEPFLLYLAYNAPHLPLEAPQETIEKYAHIDNKRRRVYAAMIDEMDRGIGMILDALKESGKFDNTLIFFLSDNGGAGGPEKEKLPFSDSGPLRDGKGSMREGGSHVPFVIHWPAGLNNSEPFDGLVSALDIAATSVALAGGDTSGNPLEGVNLIPYLNGDKEGSPHDALFWRRVDGAAWAVRTPDTKYLSMNSSTPETELYDMSTDPYESTNIVSEAPEKRAAMAKRWNEWNAGNIANIWLQAGAYQKRRLKFYEDLHTELQEKAKKRKPITIK